MQHEEKGATTEAVKKPQTGEYWIDAEGERLYVVGKTPSGQVVCVDRENGTWVFDDNPSFEHWLHIPECDSFDWVEPPAEVWPKWYVRVGNNINGSFDCLRRDAKHKGLQYGPQSQPLEFRWLPGFDGIVREGSWIEVTEAEALARVKSVKTCVMCGVQPAMPGTSGCEDCNEYAIDAAKCPVESPKRIPVRLSVADTVLKGTYGYYLTVRLASVPCYPDSVEIHSDGNGGWFVESEE